MYYSHVMYIDLLATYVVPTYFVRYDSEKLWEQYHEYLNRIYVEKVYSLPIISNGHQKFIQQFFRQTKYRQILI